MYGRLYSVIIRPSNSEHDECLDDNHELHRYIFDSMNSPYWDGLAAQYNTTCFTLDCAAIVGFTNYLPWRLYKRPKCMNYQKLVESLDGFTMHLDHGQALSTCCRDRTDPPGQCLKSCAIWFHFTTTTPGSTARTHTRWRPVLTATTVHTMPLQCKAPELFILFLIEEAVRRNNAGYEDVVQDKICHSRHLSASLCRRIDKSLFLHLR